MAQGKKKLKSNMHIGSLNIRGAGAESTMNKWFDLSAMMMRRRLGVLAVQETHLRQDDLDRLNERLKRKIFIINSSNPNQPNANGVAIILNRRSTAWAETRRWVLIPGRALMVQFPWKNSRQHRTILAVYAPNSSRENESFWITLASKWDGPNPPPRPDIMLGDTNIVEDSLDRLPIRRDDPGAVSALRGLKRKLGIVDGWRDENPDGIQYTYLQETTGSQSRIDRIYVTPKILRTTREWLVEPSDIHTDHSLVSFHYYDPGQPVHGNGRATIPLWLAKDEKFLKKAKCLVRSAVEEARMVAGGDAETPEKTYPVQEVYHALKVSLHCWAKVRVKDAQPKMRRRIESRKKELKKVVNNKEMPERERVETAAAIETEIRSMHMRHHSTGKDRTHLKYSSENEIVGKLWVNGSKEDATRDPIMALKKPQTESDPNPGLEYNSKKMAEIARDYHEKLQEEGMYNHASDEEEEQTHREVLNTIKKRLSPEQVQTLDSRLTRGEVHVALMGVPNEKAPGVDGYPIEILKALAASPKRPEEWEAEDDMTSILTLTYNEIERVGVWDENRTFTKGWMCPLYKKKDKADIANYRPITVLNVDYKILTKAMANRVAEVAPDIIHEDQAGFMKGRRIEDHTDLMRSVIDYCALEGVNGAMVLLDQEKAYDKITHKFLDRSLEKFGFPQSFRNTVKALYQNAETEVMINGHLSRSFIVKRGVRQGDPLSCLLFNIVIESLASMIRASDLRGLCLPKTDERVVVTLFADDTTVYLDGDDDFETLESILEKWCRASGAKFNVAKTEVIPLGSEEYRLEMTQTRKTNPASSQIPDGIRIAKDGEATRALGAFIGNGIGEVSIWTPTIEATEAALSRWAKLYPTIEGKRLIIGMEVGGRTQFKTRVQGMPQEVEKCFEKMITKFVWNGRMPAVNAETLRLPHEEGGFKILDVRARNEAIDLMKLKQYLTFELRPRWTQIIDHLLSRNIPTTHRVRDADAAQNMFLQSWEAAKQEKKSEAPASIRKMLKTARKYGVRAEPFEPSEDVKAEMPLWHHIGWKKGIRRRNNGARADCLRSTHEVFTVGDAVEFSQREHEPEEQPMSESESSECSWDGNNDRTHTCCEMCTIETLKGCDDMKRCQAECKRLLLGLNEMWRPLAEEEGSDSDSQETRDEEYNRSKCSSRTEMFRVFTAGPQVHKNQGKSRVHTSTTGDINIYTDGSGMNPGYEEARAGVGVWFGPEDERNYSGRVPENLPQTNNSAEALAVLVALQKVPGKENVVIHTDSKFVIDSLTTAREKTENTDWLLQSNKETLEPIISKIRRRRGKTTFKKVKGHSGIKGNEEADRLAGEGAEKPLGDKINLRIPKDARVQGAKLSEMTQALLYKGIRRAKASKTMPRRKTVAH